MKKICIALLAVTLLAGCGKEEAKPGETNQPEQTTQSTQAVVEDAYLNITPELAKQLMDTQEDYIILDVRTAAEYDEMCIPGAILIPHDEIEAQAAEKLPNKDQLILVYCRSGNRSKTASETLEKLGYTMIREFGGIEDWPYDIVAAS